MSEDFTIMIWALLKIIFPYKASVLGQVFTKNLVPDTVGIPSQDPALAADEMTAAAAAGGSAAILLGALHDTTREGRAAAAARLREYVENLEPFADDVTAFLAELHRGLSLMLTASGAHERAGAVAAIDALMEVETEENAARLPRFAGYLRTVLQHAGNDAETLEAACAALGHLARAGGALTADFVDAETKRALDTLREAERPARGAPSRERAAHELRLLSATLVLRELARSAPTALYAHVGETLRLLWPPLCAPGAPLRAAAAGALRACLELSAQRQAPARPQWVSVLLDGARDALGREGAPAAWHGALLALLALLPHAAPGTQLHAAFDVACACGAHFRWQRGLSLRLSNLASKWLSYAPARATMPSTLSSARSTKGASSLPS